MQFPPALKACPPAPFPHGQPTIARGASDVSGRCAQCGMRSETHLAFPVVLAHLFPTFLSLSSSWLQAEAREPADSFNTVKEFHEKNTLHVLRRQQRKPCGGYAIEVANRSVEGQIRTIKGRLELVLKIEINITDPIAPWVVRHASWLLNGYSVKVDGYSPYRAIKGKAIRRRSGRAG